MVSAERSAWASRMLARAEGPLEKYGSPEWHALADSDLNKWLAAVAAAEAWALDGDELEARLWTEVIALSRANKAAEDAEYLARRDAHRETWDGLDKLIGHPLAAARRQALGEVA